MNVFLGHYVEVFDAMHDTIGVDLVIAEYRRYRKSALPERVGRDNIPVILIDNREQLTAAMTRMAPLRTGILAALGVLISLQSIEAYEDIINVHPGDVHKYRGGHPLAATIVDGRPCATISVLRIPDKRIDHGPLIAQMSVALRYEEDYFTNEKRIRGHFSPLMRSLLEQLRTDGVLPGWEWQPDPVIYRGLDTHQLGRVLTQKTLEDFRLS